MNQVEVKVKVQPDVDVEIQVEVECRVQLTTQFAIQFVTQLTAHLPRLCDEQCDVLLRVQSRLRRAGRICGEPATILDARTGTVPGRNPRGQSTSCIRSGRSRMSETRCWMSEARGRRNGGGAGLVDFDGFAGEDFVFGFEAPEVDARRDAPAVVVAAVPG